MRFVDYSWRETKGDIYNISQWAWTFTTITSKDKPLILVDMTLLYSYLKQIAVVVIHRCGYSDNPFDENEKRGSWLDGRMVKRSPITNDKKMIHKMFTALMIWSRLALTFDHRDKCSNHKHKCWWIWLWIFQCENSPIKIARGRCVGVSESNETWTHP